MATLLPARPIRWTYIVAFKSVSQLLVQLDPFVAE